MTMRPVFALFLATMALSAKASPAWECEARPLIGTPTYPGTGDTEIDAKAAAVQSCEANHFVCYADDCAQLPASGTVTIKGATYYKGLILGHVDDATYIRPNLIGAPDTYDAVAVGKATPVKGDGQGSCGDCWAWARTSSLEAAILAAGLNMSSLSEEDTTDNASDEYGCGGGMMDFNYELNHGVASLASCPWQGGNGSCSAAAAAKGKTMAFVGAPGRGPTDAEMEAAILADGSVAVTTAASGNFDVAPGTDRMTDCGSQGIDHMVSFVGFRPAPDGGVEFKMKNSWGQSWGAKGYAYMKIGCNETATGDQSAMIITLEALPPTPPGPPAPAADWECSAKGIVGSTYTARAATAALASDAAVADCRSAGHLSCRVKSCEQVTLH